MAISTVARSSFGCNYVANWREKGKLLNRKEGGIVMIILFGFLGNVRESNSSNRSSSNCSNSRSSGGGGSSRRGCSGGSHGFFFEVN